MGGSIRTVQNQPQHTGLALEEQFQRFANHPGMGEMAAHHKKGAVRLGGKGGGIVRRKHRAAVYQDIIILVTEPAKNLVNRRAQKN